MRSSQGKRALCAVAIIGVLLAMVPLSAQAESWISSSAVWAQTLSTVFRAGIDNNEDDSNLVHDYANAFGVETNGSLPEDFCAECIDLTDKESLYIARDGEVLSYVELDEPEDVFLTLAACLEEKGWTWVKSGDDARATFTKNDGRYRWLYAACVDTGAQTSVVIQVIPNE